jgi:hypothetical protein
MPGLRDLVVGLHPELTPDVVLMHLQGLEWVDGQPNLIRPSPAHAYARRKLRQHGGLLVDGCWDSSSTLVGRDASQPRSNVMNYPQLLPIETIQDSPDSKKPTAPPGQKAVHALLQYNSNAKYVHGHKVTGGDKAEVDSTRTDKNTTLRRA